MLQLFDNLPDPWGAVTKSIAGILGVTIAIFTSMKMFAIVPQGHRALKTRFGRVVHNRDGSVREYEPGVMWLVPFFGGCELVDVREQHRDIGEITVEQGEYRLRSASLHLVVQVVDLYLFRYMANDPLGVIDARAREECQRLLRAGQPATNIAVEDFNARMISDCIAYGLVLRRLIIDNDMPDARMALAEAVATHCCDAVLGPVVESLTP